MILLLLWYPVAGAEGYHNRLNIKNHTRIKYIYERYSDVLSAGA
jgi:hypothetical protein